jgi:hypothetical protein
MSDLCPICENALNETPYALQSFDASEYNCPRCGEYRLNSFIQSTDEFRNSRFLISAWVRQQNKLGNKHPVIGKNDNGGNWFTNLKYLNFPQTVTQKLDALLNAYSEIAKDDYGKQIETELFKYLPAEIAGKDMKEIDSLNEFLEQLGFINVKNIARGINPLQITVRGWTKIDELQRKSESTDSAFVAMWFDDSLGKYRQAIIQAVSYCGYNPIVIDQHDFSGFIMDQIVSLIGQSRFLIADLSCKPELIENDRVKQGVRGGVYWEAGMAYGMNKPVIITCAENQESKNRIHFDLNQYPTIFWSEQLLSGGIRDLTKNVDDPTFTERVAQRILHLVGQGKYKAI